MKRTILALTLILAAIPLLAWGAARVGYKAQLRGAEVVPPVSTEGTGGILLDFSPDGKSVHFRLSVHNLADVTAAHLHLGAIGKEGPVIATLYPVDAAASVKPGSFSGVLSQGVLTAADLEGPLKGQPLSVLLREIRADYVYVKVHTKKHPGGELRGQVVPRPA